MNNVKFNYIEASFLVVIVMITHIITDLPNTIIQDCSTASILSTLFIFIIVIIYFLIIYKLFTPFENGNILNVSEFDVLTGRKAVAVRSCGAGSGSH